MTRKFDPQSGFQTGPRVKKFLDSKGIKIAELQNKTKIDRSQISRSFNQQTDLGTMSLEKSLMPSRNFQSNGLLLEKGKCSFGKIYPIMKKRSSNCTKILNPKRIGICSLFNQFFQAEL